MKLKIFLLAAVFSLAIYSCKDDQVTQDLTTVRISGTIVEIKQSIYVPISGVQVALTGNEINRVTSTDNNGNYFFEFNLDLSTTINVTLTPSKTGYKAVTPITFSVTSGQTKEVDQIILQLDTTTTIGGGGDIPTSGMPQTIAYVGPATVDLRVYGVGGVETAIITYEVRDSLGFPISIAQRDTVSFSIEGPPILGGAYVSPTWALTNPSGRVATTINSGTISGVLQIVAQLRRESDGVIVKSTPTKVVINAGLPNQTHFSIAPARLNFAGYNWVGRTNSVTVQVGDKYSNPVQTGTAVYFNTTGGIVTAAGYTNATGHASATLYSGNPLPNDPIFGIGYAWVRAQTIGENGFLVKDSVLLLFSGLPTITVTPDSIYVPRGGKQTFDVNISDQHGNPLAPGTQISSSIEFSPPPLSDWSAKIGGLPTEPLDDYLFSGPGKTDFKLEVLDATPDGTPARMPVVVKIQVTGSNGTVTKYLYGAINP